MALNDGGSEREGDHSRNPEVIVFSFPHGTRRDNYTTLPEELQYKLIGPYLCYRMGSEAEIRIQNIDCEKD